MKTRRFSTIALILTLIACATSLAGTVNIADFGAKPNDGQDDRAAIQAAFSAAGMNGTVLVNAGTYTCAGQVAINSTGMTLTSASGKLDATIEFNLPVAASNGWVNGANFAFKGGDISGLKVLSVKLRSSGGLFKADRLNNSTVMFNDFQWGWNSNYYNRLAFYVSSGADGLKIDRNYFHDSENSDRNLEIWGWANGSYSYNTFYKINDGGHIMNPGHNFHMTGNVGRLIHRMGIEIQQNSNPPDVWSKNLVIEDNVFSDWNKPYWDSMGMSVPVSGEGVTIRNNFIKQNAYNGVWGQADSSGKVRGSYGIEAPQAPAGQPGGIVEGNTIISERDVMGVSAPGKGTIVRNNKFYGPFAWNVVGGEPGALGYGDVVESNNLKDPNAANAPPVPVAPSTQPATQPTTQPVPVANVITGPPDGTKFMPGQSVTVTGTGSGTLNWSIDRIGDGEAAFAAGTGAAFTFVVPVTYKDIVTTEAHSIDVTLNGTVTRRYGITLAPPPPPPQPVTLVGVEFIGVLSNGQTATMRAPLENGSPNYTKATTKPAP